ncbi:Variant surface glycoprotein [Trypanosoma congolense IL3000]|uniref:Variant surface glycoprotein n=1 Tax=Trypanosoma congolense (strain IL3000) TaxID=1068625 RepID=F9WHE0_TRYCI|nr:Variant surface glycoprotein [Trypanosoma congolense IL3000]
MMWVMKLWMLVMVFMGVLAAEKETALKDHNHGEHKALCTVLKMVVGKWGSGGESLLEPLKTALHRTIFGNESGGSLETLRNSLPKVYEEVVQDSDSRNMACGQLRNDGNDYHSIKQPRWSGHSAPHDLVCLCTLGNNSWPLDDTQTASTLCGQEKSALGSGKGNNGWSAIYTGKEQMEATWANVTSKCLEGGGKGETLKAALKEFTDKLVLKPIEGQKNRKQLGEGKPDEYYACTGSPTRGVCVMYYPKLTAHTWWVDLEKALKEDEQLQKQREEEERRKNQEEAAKKDTNKTEDLKSTTPTTNQNEQNKTGTLHETMRKLNLTRSSSIILPSSWLLRAAFLF